MSLCKYKVSIIVPIYNRKDFIAKCINSIISQTYDNIEVILIDDGSIDDSYNICEKFTEKDRRIKLYKNQNHGVQFTRNFGIDKSTGDFITFVDADDYISNNHIEKLVFSYINSGESDLVVTGYYKVYPSGEYISHNNMLVNLDIPKDIEDSWALYFERFACYCWNHLYKSEIIKQNNIKFDKNIIMYDDTAFTMDYILHSKSVTFTNVNTYYYVCEHDSLTVSKSLNKKRVADGGSYKKIFACKYIYDNIYNNSIRLSSVLRLIISVCFIIYIGSVQYDYRFSDKEINKKVTECYNYIKSIDIKKWKFDNKKIGTKLPSMKYVKPMMTVFYIFPKNVFVSMCKIFYCEALHNLRIKLRRKRFNC